MDPGVRTFATCYDPARRRILELGRDGPKRAFGLEARMTHKKTRVHRREWGVGAAITFLWRKARRIDARAAADWRKAKKERTAREKRKLARRAGRKRAAAARFRARIRTLTADMHWRIANELCDSADVVLLPDFRPRFKVAKQGTSGKHRIIGKKTVTRLLSQSHTAFKRRLLSKAEERGVLVEIVEEDYTSKTCGRCGHVHRNLGASKTFVCPACGWTLGRDANGARNVLLKYLADSGFLEKLREASAPPVSPPTGLK